MIEKPKFKDCFHVEILESDHVFLLREGTHKVLTGPTYKRLAPWLNGENTVIDLAERLEGKISLPAIQYALNQLEKQGCIVEANGIAASKQSAFFYALGTDAHQAILQLNQSQVAFSSFSNTDASAFCSALTREGLNISHSGGDLHIVVVDDYLQLELDVLNQEAIASGRPWMPVKLVGTKSWIGPIFQPGETACWACLAQRIRANRQVESFLQRKTNRSDPIQTSFSAMPTTIQVATNLAVTEIVKWIAQGKNERLENQLLTFDHLELKLETHTVVHQPQCPTCGDPTYGIEPKPIQLTESSPEVMGSDFRSRHPEDTFNQFKHHISPISGIITGLSDMTWEPTGLTYTYAAGHYFPLVVDSVFWLRQNIKSHTGGKGTTRIQAKVSAIGEAFERYSTIYWGYEATVRGTYKSMGEQAIHPHKCMGYSTTQYKIRETWNGQLNHHSYQVLPFPFDETLEVEWVPVYSLTEQVFKYVFAPICYYAHPDSRYFFSPIDSNGVAAGNSLPEAILHGFGELVERDSVAIWWYNRVIRPGVDLGSFNLPYLTALKEYYAKLNREFWVIDITTDLGIPSFAALSRRIDSPVEDIIYGFGAHFNPQTAILQAVTEMNQSLPAVRAKPDGTTDYRWPQQDAIDWWQTATIINQPYLYPDETVVAKQLADYPLLTKPSMPENVELCIEITRRVGLEMLALDLTRPDVGMNVCRIIVPGMRHFWRRLGPGRLYDVPVKLGWLEQPSAEEEMNPEAIFF